MFVIQTVSSLLFIIHSNSIQFVVCYPFKQYPVWCLLYSQTVSSVLLSKQYPVCCHPNSIQFVVCYPNSIQFVIHSNSIQFVCYPFKQYPVWCLLFVQTVSSLVFVIQSNSIKFPSDTVKCITKSPPNFRSATNAFTAVRIPDRNESWPWLLWNNLKCCSKLSHELSYKLRLQPKCNFTPIRAWPVLYRETHQLPAVWWSFRGQSPHTVHVLHEQTPFKLTDNARLSHIGLVATSATLLL